MAAPALPALKAYLGIGPSDDSQDTVLQLCLSRGVATAQEHIDGTAFPDSAQVAALVAASALYEQRSLPLSQWQAPDIRRYIPADVRLYSYG